MAKTAESVFDFEAETLDGRPIRLAELAGKVLLIVNTASQCGFTPQYTGLEKLYQTYRARGLEVLGFPCNQFGSQEPGSAAEIGSFCEKNYGVSFPMFAKIEVNGEHAHPLYRFLKKEKSGLLGPLDGGSIKWNFTKFLVDRQGQVVARFGSATKPESLSRDIEKLLDIQPDKDLSPSHPDAKEE
ncbi:MAG TPA: glutathione peroxidase [Terracidiphilus sp.]